MRAGREYSRWAQGALVVGLIAISTPSVAEVWNIDGSDAQLGAFNGRLEVRPGSDGTLDVIRIATLQNFQHHDGRSIELVWTGSAQISGPNTATAKIRLLRADFISEAGGMARTDADRTPLEVVAEARIDADLGLSINYSASGDPSFSVTESAVLSGQSGTEPIWTAQRVVNETHREPGFLEKASLFVTFSSFHDLPAVAPFTNDPLFERAVHLQTIEHSDFGYYRANPDRIRVINKVVDAISLAETEVRANAFRASLAEKAQFYQADLTREFVGSHGMVVNSIEANGQSIPDLDGALWTGVYIVTQALRYQATGDNEALDNLRRSLTGVLMLMDITGDPRTFARTLRLAGPPLTDSWHRGLGQYSAFDWRAGGNNDMSRGLLLGMIAGWQALPENDPLRTALQRHALDLMQLCAFAEPRPSECEAEGSDFNLPKTNPGAAKLLAGITNGDPALVADGLDWLRQPALLQYADAGGGPFYTFGVSDWSGNHLTLTATVALQWLLARTQDTALQQRWRSASATAWEILRRLESPLHAAVALTANAVDGEAGRTEARDEVLWGLRSFPLPKHPYPVDHRLRRDFVVSPFPARPWKLDWKTNLRSPQSITAYPMLEQAIDAYRWNDAHFQVDFMGLGDRRVPGVDYLILYWIARAGGLIGPND